MGSDKTQLAWEGQNLLERALKQVRAVTSKVWIVGSREKFERFGPVVEDEFPDHGPLGGIHAGLRASHARWNLVLAVDMPFVEARFLEYLLSRARGRKAVVTVPRVGGVCQPLCAVYRRRFAGFAEPALQAGKNKIEPLFSQCNVEVVEEAELLGYGYSTEMFRNLNTPEDVRAARKV